MAEFFSSFDSRRIKDYVPAILIIYTRRVPAIIPTCIPILPPNDPCTQRAATGQWPFHPFHIASQRSFQRRVLTHTLYPLPQLPAPKEWQRALNPFTSRPDHRTPETSAWFSVHFTGYFKNEKNEKEGRGRGLVSS